VSEEAHERAKMSDLGRWHRFFNRWTTASPEDKKKWKKIMLGDVKKKRATGAAAAHISSNIARAVDAAAREEAIYNRLRTVTTRPGRYTKDMKSWFQGVLT